MSFSERRARLGRRWRVRAACAGLAAIVALLARRAAVRPPRRWTSRSWAGMSFDGPTSANLGAVYWNPAALGLVRGFQLMVAGSGRLSTVDVNRASIDPTTGMPGGTTTVPGGAGARSDLAVAVRPAQLLRAQHGLRRRSLHDRVRDVHALPAADHLPAVAERQRADALPDAGARPAQPAAGAGAVDPLRPLSPNQNEPTRYHALALDLRNLALAPALSIRFGNDFRVGFAPGFLFSTGRLIFAEDLGLDGGTLVPRALHAAPVRRREPGAAARYDVSSGNGLGDAKFSVTLGAGIYYRRKSFELGVAYQSRPLGSDVPGVEVAGQHTTVTLPPRDPMGGGSPLTCPNGQSSRCIFGDVSYRLPDVWIAGATWRLAPGLELSAMVRWLWLHDARPDRHPPVGPDAGHDGHDIPQHIVLYRGFKDVWDTRVRVSYWWRERVRVGAMLRVETSAVDTRRRQRRRGRRASRSSPSRLIEFRLLRQLWLGGGYGVTFMRAVDVTDSVFKPELATACASIRASTTSTTPTSPARGGWPAARVRPPPGHYTAQTQDFGMTDDLEVLMPHDIDLRTCFSSRCAFGLPGLACAAARGPSGGGRATPRAARPGRRRGDRGRRARRPPRWSRWRSASLGALAARKWRLAERPRGRAGARSAGDQRQLHDLVPRRLAQRGRARRARRASRTCSST